MPRLTIVMPYVGLCVSNPCKQQVTSSRITCNTNFHLCCISCDSLEQGRMRSSSQSAQLKNLIQLTMESCSLNYFVKRAFNVHVIPSRRPYCKITYAYRYVRISLCCKTSLCVSFLRQLTTWHCSHLLPNAGRAAIDRYLLAAGPTAVNLPLQRAATEWRDGRTDIRTDARQFHRPYSAREQCQRT